MRAEAAGRGVAGSERVSLPRNGWAGTGRGGEGGGEGGREGRGAQGEGCARGEGPARPGQATQEGARPGHARAALGCLPLPALPQEQLHMLLLQVSCAPAA